MCNKASNLEQVFQRAAIPIFLVISLFPAIGISSDAEFSRALKEARCIPTQVSTLAEQRNLTIYEITCAGNPPRKIGMSCFRAACSVSSNDDEDSPSPSQQ